MAPTTLSDNVIFLTNKFASSILTLQFFAAVSLMVTKSSCEIRNKSLKATPLTKCFSQEKNQQRAFNIK